MFYKVMAIWDCLGLLKGTLCCILPQLNHNTVEYLLLVLHYQVHLEVHFDQENLQDQGIQEVQASHVHQGCQLDQMCQVDLQKIKCKRSSKESHKYLHDHHFTRKWLKKIMVSSLLNGTIAFQPISINSAF